LRRAQAKVYVLARAGDLTGALTIAREGLSIRPDDLWLLERTCSLAIAIHSGSEAREALDRMVHVVDRAPLEASERDRWNATVASYSRSVSEIAQLSAQQERAKARARCTIVVVGAAILSALFGLAFSAQKKPPQRSVDSQGRPSSPGFS
jgi:hypothetical protein